jgi:hypothetical protein
MTIRPKDRKLAELILFISERSEGDPRFGAGKLNKLLFYSDFGAYRLFGKSITGQQYQKLSNGPAPRRLAAIRDALLARHELAIRQKESSNRNAERSFALRSANLSVFSADEIALVTRIIQENWENDEYHRGYYSTDSAHWEGGVAEFETIPYEWALLSKRPPTDKDRRMCEASGALATAVLSGERKVYPVDEKTLLGPGIRQPARRSRATRASDQRKPEGSDVKTANRSRVRRKNQRKSSPLVRSNAGRH